MYECMTDVILQYVQSEKREITLYLLKIYQNVYVHTTVIYNYLEQKN